MAVLQTPHRSFLGTETTEAHLVQEVACSDGGSRCLIGGCFRIFLRNQESLQPEGIDRPGVYHARGLSRSGFLLPKGIHGQPLSLSESPWPI